VLACVCVGGAERNINGAQSVGVSDDVSIENGEEGAPNAKKRKEKKKKITDSAQSAGISHVLAGLIAEPDPKHKRHADRQGSCQ
jgi:hypothetical protein